MKAYDEKCAGCRWLGPIWPSIEMCGHSLSFSYRKKEGGDCPLSATVTMRKLGPCGPVAKLFEPKETR